MNFDKFCAYTLTARILLYFNKIFRSFFQSANKCLTFKPFLRGGFLPGYFAITSAPSGLGWAKVGPCPPTKCYSDENTAITHFTRYSAYMDT